MDIETTKKGKPTSVTDDDGVEYLCIAKSALEGMGKPLQKAIDEGRNSHFLSGYVYALTQLDWSKKMFGELPDLPELNLEPRKVIQIQGVNYYEDEVVDRLGILPSKTSIWRN